MTWLNYSTSLFLFKTTNNSTQSSNYFLLYCKPPSSLLCCVFVRLFVFCDCVVCHSFSLEDLYININQWIWFNRFHMNGGHVISVSMLVSTGPCSLMLKIEKMLSLVICFLQHNCLVCNLRATSSPLWQQERVEIMWTVIYSTTLRFMKTEETIQDQKRFWWPITPG